MVSKMKVRKKFQRIQCLTWAVKFHRSSYTQKNLKIDFLPIWEVFKGKVNGLKHKYNKIFGNCGP